MTERLDPDVREALEILQGCWSHREAELKLSLSGYETSHLYYGIVADPASGKNVLQLADDGVYVRCADGRLSWQVVAWKRIKKFLELNS